MEKVIIEQVKISKFKNLIDVQYQFDPKSKVIIFKGRNGIGKSNMLNSMYWCLTGVDLNNSSQTEDFIPKKLREEYGTVVDVEVKLNVLKIRRKIERTTKGLSESLILNDIPTETLKAGEIEIDSKLGLLPYTLSSFSNKDFSMRRFVLNPNYIYSLSPKAMRDVVVKRYSTKCDPKFNIEILNKSLVENTFKEYANEDDTFSYLTLCGSIAKAQSLFKSLKDQNEMLKTAGIVIATLKNCDTTVVQERIEELYNDSLKRINKVDSQLKVLDMAKLEFEKKFCEIAKEDNPLINFELITTNSKGVEKSTFEITSNDIEVRQRSTSESIFDGINMIQEYFIAVGFDGALPLFIDKAESIDSSKLITLFSGERQIFATQVQDRNDIKMEVESL